MQNKQQEFLKQREKLKYVTQNTMAKNALDADIMIKQLMSDKETFKFYLEPQLPHAIPKWLIVENNLVPAVYEQVWQAVKVGPTFQYCDTIMITHLFTTSRLSFEKLGYLWSLTNVSSSGFLTRQELYVMLALIALVQTGYHVHDISILTSINHPILPQLDFSFLKINVGNAVINQRNDVKNTRTLVYNGFYSVPLYKPSDLASSKSPKNTTFSNTDVESLKNSLPNVEFIRNDFNVESSRSNFLLDGPNLHKPEIDVSVVSERKNDSSNFTPTAPKLGAPISSIRMEPTTARTNFNVAEPRNLVNSLTNGLEPQSLDFNKSVLDDEFSEFQSATVAIDEYSDFQSASPIDDRSASAKLPQSIDLIVANKIHSVEDKLPSLFDSTSRMEVEEHFLKHEPDHKTSTEADKYDVFRTLMESSEEKPQTAGCKDEEEFGDFNTADVKSNGEKRELPIKDKCLEACLRLLLEGLQIFSSTNETTVMEVLSDERGCSYFYQLKIVYDTSQRFQRQFESTHLNDTIQSTWAKISKYSKYISNQDLLDEIPSEDDVDATPCKLCETKCDVNCVRYAGHNYHVTCINLFLHFVEDSEITAMLNI